MILTTRDRLVAIITALSEIFVGRDESLRVVVLAMLTGNNFLLVGDPGTAKTALIRAFVGHVANTTYFQSLCGSFTTLDELVGPPDIGAFKAGEWRRCTVGKLPGVEFAFLDEVMKSNDGTINSLLSILNERKFDNQPTPLWCVGAATNWPEVTQRTEKVDALFDRFTLRHHVEAVPIGSLHTKMLKSGDLVANYRPSVYVSVTELREASAAIGNIHAPDAVYERITDVVTRLRARGVVVSDRRAVKSLSVLRASAWIAGRDSVTMADFEVLNYMLWSDRDQIAEVRSVIATLDQATLRAVAIRVDEVLSSADSLKNMTDRRARLVKISAVLSDMMSVGIDTRSIAESGSVSVAGVARLARLMMQLKGRYKRIAESAIREIRPM